MAATAGKIVRDTTSDAADSGGVDTSDLTKNVVDLISEKTAIQADALVLKTGQQMVGTLLDILDTAHRA